jgi:hypothetical protein
MPNSPDAILRESEAEPPTRDPSSENALDYQARTSTTILPLRRFYGPHFAPGYGDNETSAISSPELASILSTSISNATTARPANSNVQEPHQPQRPSPSP